MKTTFKLRVLTPMFMSGAEPHKEPELRAASIRGAMRFWFRAMAGAVTSDPREVYRLESEIFGNTERKSKVVVRVKTLSKKPIHKGSNVPRKLAVNPAIIKKLEKDDRKKRKFEQLVQQYGEPAFESKIENAYMLNFLAYLANMGLAEYDKNRRDFVWSRNGLDAGTIFEVQIIGVNSEIIKVASNTFQTAVALGGFGTRWRHGFGSCEIVEINGNSPNKFDFSTIEKVIEKIKTLAESLKIKIAPEKEFNNLPDFPSFAIPYYQIWEGQRPDEKKWDSLLSYIGKTYREFRIHDGNNYRFDRFGHTWDFLNIVKPIFESKKIKNNDPQNDVFGLPIQFSKQYGGKRKTAIINVKEKEINRRASPLILHVEPDRGLIRATLFKSKFLPDNAKYTIDKMPSLKLQKPSESDFQRVEQFLRELGLSRRYPNA